VIRAVIAAQLRLLAQRSASVRKPLAACAHQMRCHAAGYRGACSEAMRWAITVFTASIPAGHARRVVSCGLVAALTSARSEVMFSLLHGSDKFAHHCRLSDLI